MAYGETRKRVEFMIGTKAFSTLEEAKRYAKEWANDEGRPIHISKETTVYRQLGTLFPKTSMSRREYVVKPSKRSRKNPRNGRSYVVRGEIPKRYWEPSQGDVVYIEGTKTRLGKPYADPDTGKLMFPLRPSVRGTTDMGAGNIKAIARVEEGKGLESVGSTATFSRRPNPEPITPVIFRKFPASEGGEVIALFPYDREDYGRMSSYMHTGQHSAASHMLVYKTKLATPAEYADLKRELEGIGYRLKVIKKGPSYRALARAAALSKEGNPRTRKTRDVWVVQGNYGYGDGWEDVTAEETYREARQRLKEYRENEPQYPHRLKLTREKIETSVSNPAALPTKWTSATVSRKGRQIQIRIGRGR